MRKISFDLERGSNCYLLITVINGFQINFNIIISKDAAATAQYMKDYYNNNYYYYELLLVNHCNKWVPN